jgi:integrase
MLILTGQRRNEVCAASRKEFNLQDKRWIIAPERAKNGVEHLVPLSDAARDLVARLPEIDGESVFLFSTNGRTAVSGFSKWKGRLDAAITKANGGKPIEHWTIHDIRRTFSSGWARLRILTEVTEKALNHTSGSFGGVAGVYNVHDYEDERREAMEAWSRYVMALVDGKQPQNVVSLRPVA